jgi:hypothetical protein
MSGRRRLAPRAARPNAARRVLAAFAWLLAPAIALAPRPARAGDPFEIQVYDGTANTPGVFGLELHLNDWATGHHDAPPPEAPLHGQFHATLEPSFGVTPFWELGAYLQGAVRTDDGVVDWAGVKLRSKFFTPPSFDPHWRLGANFELAYLPDTYDHDRWGVEVRPIAAWHSDAWLFALNPILDQPLAGSDASNGPSFEPCIKALRAVGPVGLGVEYYATLGPVGAIYAPRDQEHYLFGAVDWLTGGPIELNAAVGAGLTPESSGVVFKMILGYTFEREGPTPPTATSLPTAASNDWRWKRRP